MKARIYQPAKNAMQSGRAKTAMWVLEYEPETPRVPEPLMDSTSAGDTLGQVTLKFETCAAAEAFARKEGLAYSVSAPHERVVVPRNYVDNYKYRPARSNNGK